MRIVEARKDMAFQRRAILLTTGGMPLLLLISIIFLGCGRSRDEDHRKMAAEYLTRGEIAAAIQELEKLDQPTADDYSWRGELLMERGRPQFNKAVAAFESALMIDRGNPRALYGLALLAILQKQFESAEELSRKLLELQPNSLQAQNLLAGALIYLGKHGEAEDLLLALEMEPTMAGIAKVNLGELYLRQGKLNLAEAKLKEAMLQQPNNFDQHRLLGEVYRLQGRKRAALIEYRRTLELLETSPWADAALPEGIQLRIRELEEKQVH